MVQARRAKAQPARIIIPLAVAAALLVGGLFAAWKFWPNATTAGPQAASSTTAAESQAPSTRSSRVLHPRPPLIPPARPPQEALEACQAKVKAADAVLKQGENGVRTGWTTCKSRPTPSPASSRTRRGRRRFAKTRVKGPGDLKRYDDALDAYENLEGSCDTVDGADSTVAAALKKCDERSEAQQPVLKATAAGMDDWKTHVKFMQYNKEHPDPDAAADRQTSWLKQYNGAPKNIKAFKKATEDFDAPDC